MEEEKTNHYLQLHKLNKQIDSLLDDSVDEETGEISEDVIEKINSLDISRESIYKDVALINIQYSNLDEYIGLEIRRLQALRKSATSRVNITKKLLQKSIPEGQKYDFGNVKISWRKSEIVDICNPFFDLEKLEKEYPELVKTERDLRKNEVKKFIKETGVIIAGLELITKQNIQIK